MNTNEYLNILDKVLKSIDAAQLACANAEEVLAESRYIVQCESEKLVKDLDTMLVAMHKEHHAA